VLGDLVSVMDKIPMLAFVSDDRRQLLQSPVCAWVFGHIDVREAARPVLDDNKHIELRNVAVTATKKSHARIALP
jgi:hypothetical protein